MITVHADLLDVADRARLVASSGVLTVYVPDLAVVPRAERVRRGRASACSGWKLTWGILSYGIAQYALILFRYCGILLL